MTPASPGSASPRPATVSGVAATPRHDGGARCAPGYHYFRVPDRLVGDITVLGRSGLISCEDVMDFPDGEAAQHILPFTAHG